MYDSSVLKKVSKPGRYSGGEYGQILKSKDAVKCRFAFCFPDAYEIGMSNLGMRILYGALNQSPDIWCEQTVSSALAGQDAGADAGASFAALRA